MSNVGLVVDGCSTPVDQGRSWSAPFRIMICFLETLKTIRSSPIWAIPVLVDAPVNNIVFLGIDRRVTGDTQSGLGELEDLPPGPWPVCETLSQRFWPPPGACSVPWHTVPGLARFHGSADRRPWRFQGIYWLGCVSPDQTMLSPFHSSLKLMAPSMT